MGLDKEAVWFRLLDLNVEGNIPTWYTSIILALAAVTAGLVAKALPVRQRYRKHWMGVALISYLSIDEAARIHES